MSFTKLILSAIFQKFEMPSPLNLEGKDSSFLSMYEQLVSPDVASVNSNLVKHEYVSYVSKQAVLHNILGLGKTRGR